ncbi:hypothetical protein VP01_1612g8 [Puccinia sorghi]|uniref:Tet-like 2OG-Fe(II) oxygenase domain-containing protein n=1 Tax=Puccinia sorghi TaxID=27349 RepID=A0A0L6VIY9_9BASI|nr:hypothetical protein VP01_1612g8 [Puccinia sorghi]
MPTNAPRGPPCEPVHLILWQQAQQKNHQHPQRPHHLLGPPQRPPEAHQHPQRPHHLLQPSCPQRHPMPPEAPPPPRLLVFCQATHQSTNQTPCIQSQIHSFAGLINLGKKSLLLSSSIRFQLWILLLNHHTNFSAEISLLKQPIRIPTSQMALDMLGRCIIWDQKGVQRILTDITRSKAMFLNKTPSLTNSSTWFPVLYLMRKDPDSFTCNFWFTISNFAKKPHKDNDASPFTFVIKILNSFFLMIHVVLNFQDSMALWSVPGRSLHILT